MMIELTVGDIVCIDTSATRNKQLVVAESRQYQSQFCRPMFDYVLEGDADALPMRLRFYAGDDADTRPVLLSLIDRFPYDGAMERVVRDASGTLTIHEDAEPSNVPGDIFWRILDRKESYIRSVNRCSNIGASTATVECWDYSRLTDVKGVETEEFVFVEMNKSDGWFEIWRGMEISPGMIAVSSSCESQYPPQHRSPQPSPYPAPGRSDPRPRR